MTDDANRNAPAQEELSPTRNEPRHGPAGNLKQEMRHDGRSCGERADGRPGGQAEPNVGKKNRTHPKNGKNNNQKEDDSPLDGKRTLRKS